MKNMSHTMLKVAQISRPAAWDTHTSQHLKCDVNISSFAFLPLFDSTIYRKYKYNTWKMMFFA